MAVLRWQNIFLGKNTNPFTNVPLDTDFSIAIEFIERD